MEPIFVGWLSLVPPLLAISLALITKEVISSLIVGILSGALIYSLAAGELRADNLPLQLPV